MRCPTEQMAERRLGGLLKRPLGPIRPAKPPPLRFPKLSREEAYMIASVAVDYRITQVVDGTKGIHGMIPKSIFVGQ
jgi:hypothetical protein